jgi:hypothetical protein
MMMMMMMMMMIIMTMTMMMMTTITHMAPETKPMYEARRSITKLICWRLAN